MERFWMVKGDGPTSARHDSHDSAVAEAKRLARMNPGTQFVVLVAIAAFERSDVAEVPIHEPYEMTPF